IPVTNPHVTYKTSIAEATEDALDQSTFETLYIRMFENAAPRIVQALAIIATSPGAAAFHCAAGQDRSGVLAASLLKVLGADDEAIVEDYVRTCQDSEALMSRLSPVMGRLVAVHCIELEEAAMAAARSEFSPAPMRGLLAHLAGTYADPIEPLRAAGLTTGLIEALRERAVA